MSIRGIKKKECEICGRLIPEHHDYCEIHRDPEIIKMHEKMKARLKENKGKSCYLDYLKKDNLKISKVY